MRAGRLAESGTSYRLTLTVGGDLLAEFVPGTIRVPLGTQGASIQITSLESGGFRHDGATVRSGQTITVNGNQYRVTVASARLVGEFVPQPVSIAVRGSDTPVTILCIEDGSYEREGKAVLSGDEVEVGDATYELIFLGGAWNVSPVAGPIVIVPAGAATSSS